MNGIYSTGNSIVDENAKINITGNIIPQIWYKTIVKENGKPNLNAIIILSDIVYWYKPTEIRDETSGQIIAVKKKFKADLLQRNYQQIADQFGISKREATNAIIFLESKGIIKRVLRNMTLNGMVINNILFIDLIVEKLKEFTFQGQLLEQEMSTYEESDRITSEKERAITFESGRVSPEIVRTITLERDRVLPEEGRAITFESERVSLQKVIGSTFQSDTTPQNEEIGVTFIGDTNTKTTTKTTAIEYNNIIQSYQEVLMLFREQIDYDAIRCDCQGDSTSLDELVNTAVDILTSTCKHIRINKDDKPISLVKAQFMKLNMFHIKYVLSSLNECESKARNIRAVMITALYNSVNSISNYYSNLYNYHENGRSEHIR